MSKRDAIDAVLEAKTIAIAGVSRNPNKFGSAVFKELAESGKNVVGITPHMTSFLDRPCYPSVDALPGDVEALITVVKPAQTLILVKAAAEKGIRNIWMQQGSESNEAIAFCRESELNFVSKACVMMYAEPVKSIHRFHRGLARLFGTYRKAV